MPPLRSKCSFVRNRDVYDDNANDHFGFLDHKNADNENADNLHSVDHHTVDHHNSHNNNCY